MKSSGDAVLGARSIEEIRAYLREIGDEAAAERFERGGPTGQFSIPFLSEDPYAYTGVLLGYVESRSGPEGDIVGVHQIEADDTLKGARIKVTLEQFYVHSYPGLGKHTILCEFGGMNQVAGSTEEMKFALTVEANDGEGAGIFGKPIFMGVNVGEDGLGLRGKTVNVRSEVDALVLDALNGEAFRQGLSLVSTMQPALKPFVGLATSVVKAASRRKRNCPVFEFELGLDFTRTGSGARLRKGSYIVVQHNEQDWNWSRFAYVRDTRIVLQKADRTALALNYMVIGVDDFAGQAAPAVTSLTKPAKPSPKGR